MKQSAVDLAVYAKQSCLSPLGISHVACLRNLCSSIAAVEAVEGAVGVETVEAVETVEGAVGVEGVKGVEGVIVGCDVLQFLVTFGFCMIGNLMVAFIDLFRTDS